MSEYQSPANGKNLLANTMFTLTVEIAETSPDFQMGYIHLFGLVNPSIQMYLIG